jgi:CRISPR-associated exonuclease Cas4
MFSEDDLLPLSGLQHLMFCERQWGLIHIEMAWSENRLTAEGRVLHEKAHDAGVENRPGIRITRGLRLRSLRLGLSGQADVVEFQRSVPGGAGVALPDAVGLWRPFPVEYKRGRPKRDACDEAQLCAQALCMEEMFGGVIPSGALYYGERRRREEVAFGPSLRDETEKLAARMHLLYRARRTPLAEYGPKCGSCSLLAQCMPRLLAKPPAVGRYLARALELGDD